MIGLAFIAAFILYFSVSIGVVILVVRWARRRGRQPFIWGLLVALVMYHLVFWDYLPTLIVYNHYVKTKSGFWVYKTPEQWKEENPGVAVTLIEDSLSTNKYNASGITRSFMLNDRFAWVFKEHKNEFLPITIQEEIILDIKKSEDLVKRIRVYSGLSGDAELMRFWTSHRQPPFKIKEFHKLKTDYTKIGEIND